MVYNVDGDVRISKSSKTFVTLTSTILMIMIPFVGEQELKSVRGSQRFKNPMKELTALKTKVNVEKHSD